MSNDDPQLASALWLAAGSASGYAAGRYVVGPLLATGPSGTMQPTDPYAPPLIDTVTTPAPGPSGDLRPIDPYGEAPTPASITPSTSPVVIAIAPSAAVPAPITKPSQVEAISSRPTEVTAHRPTTSPVFATKPRVRRFDPVFVRYRGELPIEYLRALVERESDGLPKARAGQAIGLMQIVPVVLTDHNKRHGTAYRADHLTDPAINVAIGCELLRIIVESYRKHHPRIITLRTDWNNLRFVELLTFGWNAGFSESGGLGRVARYLEGLGAVDITIDQVSAHARLAGATKHLSNPAKVAWSKGVVALYQRERALTRAAFASA